MTENGRPNDPVFDQVAEMADHEVWWRIELLSRRLRKCSEETIWRVDDEVVDVLVRAAAKQSDAQASYEAARQAFEGGDGDDPGIYEMQASDGYMRTVRWALVRYLRKKAYLDRVRSEQSARSGRR